MRPGESEPAKGSHGGRNVPAGPGPMSCQQSILRCDLRMIQVSHLPLRLLQVTAAERLCPCSVSLPWSLPTCLAISLPCW